VRRHLAVREALPALPLEDVREQPEEPVAVEVVEEDRTPIDATDEDVVDAAVDLDAERTGDRPRMPRRGRLWAVVDESSRICCGV
jgi:hypothetical protein